MPPRFVVPIPDLVRQLETDGRWAAHIAAKRVLPAEAPRLGGWPDPLAPVVRAAAESLGIADLYTHQAAAVAAALGGEHVAVATGTASGKSLCYLLPVMDRLLRDPTARAIFVFPTKALAHDQLAALRRWDAALPQLALHPAAYDGDTPTSARGTIRRTARIVVTNPDMLHTAILPHHTQWATLFEGLSHIVLDEMHVYRGVFGSHVANVLRRLRRITRFYGARPRFVLTSATIANPGELGAALTGGAVRVVADDGAPRGRRSFIFYNPPVVDETLGIRRSPLLEAEALARHFLAGGVQTIVFAKSRQAAELIRRYVSEGMSEQRRDIPVLESPLPEPDELVRGYRAGYTAGERRAIEAGLRNGSLRGVVATNALELGIDIGELDACVMAGYPGTIASTWQQAGRAGRQAMEAVAVLVAGSAPLDQFMMRHPDYFFGRSPEHARLQPDNLLMLLDHVRCAAFELPFGEEEAGLPFGGAPEATGELSQNETVSETAGSDPPIANTAGPPVQDLLAVLEAQGVVQHVAGTWYWLADAYPAEAVNLRQVGPTQVRIIRGLPLPDEAAAEPEVWPANGLRVGNEGDERSNDRPRNRDERVGVRHQNRDERSSDQRPSQVDILGTVERSSAAVTVHPGAVYLHDGQVYQVERLDWEEGRAFVTPADGTIYTRASSRTSLKPMHISAERTAQGASIGFGEVEVTSRATSYRQVRFRTHETVGWGKIDLPELVHIAGGYWCLLDAASVEALKAIGRWHFDPTGDRGPNWPEQRDLARARDDCRCRLCGAPEPPGRSHDVHHIRPFHAFGWQKGRNDAYRLANVLDNLITLCKACHQAAERALGLHGGLQGVGYALAHVAPLYLMCDPRDLGVSAESHAPWSKRPTIAIYERAAAGVGFGEALYELHDTLVAACDDLIAGCPCPAGCPACVGPAEGLNADAKVHARAVLGVLRAHES